MEGLLSKTPNKIRSGNEYGAYTSALASSAACPMYPKIDLSKNSMSSSQNIVPDYGSQCEGVQHMVHNENNMRPDTMSAAIPHLGSIDRRAVSSRSYRL